jgi:hypothetical protein
MCDGLLRRRAILRPVLNPQDFDGQLVHAIKGDVWKRMEQEFAGTFLAPHASAICPLFQGLDPEYSLRMVGCR